jgi:TRAP-type C4-dicarboxylate transport system permease small subunit
MITEKFPKLTGTNLSKSKKRIIATSVITFIVFMFFIWLGVGMYIYVPEESRGELWPVFGMYAVFPMLIFFFGIKRVYSILNGEEEETKDLKNSEEEN